ncbi:hypothetical protein [Streptomyces sp. NPDC001828]|uniref:hypothetical protein n=1 Tax=Streptomyces sp. NPDC001828 TaxID=3364615 RepID=UPI0036924F27
MSLWIGRSGALREFPEAAVTYDRSNDLGVSEFRALSGALTTWVPPVQPRRMKLTWTSMALEDAQFLDRLARRVDGPGPVRVIDPASENWFFGPQANGLRSINGAVDWRGDPGAKVTVNSGSALYDPVTVSAPAGADGWFIIENARDIGGFPVMPGGQVTFWAPELAAVVSDVRLIFYGPAPLYASVGSIGGQGFDRPVVASVPAGAATVRPSLKINRGFANWAVGRVLLRRTRPGDESLRVPFREALPAAQALGSGPTSQWNYAAGITLSQSGGQVMFSGKGGIDWAPTGGRGFPVQPGESVTFTHSVPGVTSFGLQFIDAAGKDVTLSAGMQAAQAPSASAYVKPWIGVGDTPAPTPIGPASLSIGTPSAIAIPPGEGGSQFSVAGFTQSVRPGRLSERDVSLDLVEVVNAVG